MAWYGLSNSASRSVDEVGVNAVSTRTPAHDVNNVDWNELDVTRLITISTALATAENIFFYPISTLKTREQAVRLSLLTVTTTPSVSSTAHANSLTHPVHLTFDSAVTRLRPISGFVASLRDHACSALSASVQQCRDSMLNGGMRSLYKGFWTSSIGYMPSYASYLMTYSYCKHALGWSNEAARDPWKSIYIPLVAGIAADVASLVLYIPVDVVVQRMQLKDAPFTGGIDATSRIFKEEGLRGLYRGAGAHATYSCISSAVWWISYEKVKTMLTRSPEQVAQERHVSVDKAADTPQRMPQFVAGLCAGTVTAVVVNPIDVVTTRLQTQAAVFRPCAASSEALPPAPTPTPGQPHINQHAHVPYKHLLHGLRMLVKEEGFRGFGLGLLPSIAYKAPLSALTSILYELTFYYSRSPSSTKTLL